MQGLQMLLALGNWAGSIYFGWNYSLWWLLVPPIAFSVYALGLTANVKSHMRSNGIPPDRFGKEMLRPNIILVIHNTILNSALFAIAAGVSYLIS